MLWLFAMLTVFYMKDTFGGHTPSRRADYVKYFSTTRAYEFDNSNAESSEFYPEGCQPVRFWYFGRHGTRSPNPTLIVQMNTQLPHLQASIIHATTVEGQGDMGAVSRLSNWKPNTFDDKKGFTLLEKGWNELEGIGERYKSRFQDLFPSNPAATSEYFLLHTKAERTKDSAKAFAKGMFKGNSMTDLNLKEADSKEERILEFYKSCPKWNAHKKTVNPENQLYLESDAIQNVIKNMRARLGLPNLTFDDIEVMYTACTYETAADLTGNISPWCDVFSLDDVKAIMYMQDMDYNWKGGYGSPVNYEQACPPFSDLKEYFEEHKKNPSNPNLEKIRLYFSHSGSMTKMLARLNLFETKNMTSEAYPKIKDTYTWRSSEIDKMASNMAFSLLSCPRSIDGEIDYKVGFYYQEVPTAFEACGGAMYCPLQDFIDKVIPFSKACNLSGICAR